ncbi:Pal1 cell morphology protein-domain-containing protein [Fusarium acuminatum]|uniref:Pal1 cell morphology protein-domain-containing protein n=1 Tax=Fusarium acuminatum TaxID=5515 RepID=A0ABZ2XA69_9HYPO
MSSHSDSKSLSAEEIFNSMTLDENNERARQQAARRPSNGPPPRRGENAPPKDGNHRPTRSQEEAIRARRMQGSGPRPQPSSPQRRGPSRRPRRNSESSLVDFDARPITEEEKKMIEAARRREYERQRRGDGKERSDRSDRDRDRERRDRGERSERGERSDKDKSSRPSRKMDIIDQLDATSIYGTGHAVFHHDGPFDALNPHRNRQNARRAPMQAFPKDSLNNSLGGAGPLNARADHSVLMGNATEEAFRDFAAPTKARKEPPIFDASGRDKIVHGDESVGLGTSTFLEGTPAPRSAIQRHQAEQAQENLEGGLQRKKSLAQRIRHINKGPRDYNQAGRANGDYTRITPDAYPTAASTGSDRNPFFTEFGKGEENISVRPRDGSMTSNSPPGARRPSAGAVLERRATTDAPSALEDAPPKPSGLMGRMKSLKGRKTRPEIPSNGPSVPGTAV